MTTKTLKAITSRWKCPKCGSTVVQVSYPTWYREYLRLIRRRTAQ